MTWEQLNETMPSRGLERMPGLGATGHILTAITVSKADETTRQSAHTCNPEQKSCPSVRLPNFMKHASDQKTQVDHRIRRHKLRHASVHTLIFLPTLIQQTSSKSSNNASSKHSLARHHADHWLLCVLRTHRPGRAQHKPCILKYLAPKVCADV